jgi:hypothetical protein
VAAGLLNGCTTSTIYVTSTSQQMYFKLPSSWKLYNEAQLERLGDTPQGTLPPFVDIATAAPNGPPDPFTPSKYPWAMAEVTTLTGQVQQQMSLETLDDVLEPVDQFSSQLQGSVTPLSQPRVLVYGALHGTRVSFEILLPSGGTISYDQSAVLNSPNDKVWVLAVGCSTACFNSQQAVITKIMDSWTVRDKGTS